MCCKDNRFNWFYNTFKEIFLNFNITSTIQKNPEAPKCDGVRNNLQQG